MNNILLSTTGLTPSIIFRDLGERIFNHPTTNYNIGSEFSHYELSTSNDFNFQLDSGYISILYNGIYITSSYNFLPSILGIQGLTGPQGLVGPQGFQGPISVSSVYDVDGLTGSVSLTASYLKLDGTNSPLQNIDWNAQWITNISKLRKNGSGAGAGWDFDLNFSTAAATLEAIDGATSKRTFIQALTNQATIRRITATGAQLATEWTDNFIKNSLVIGSNQLSVYQTLTGLKMTRDNSTLGINQIFPVTSNNIDITWRDKGSVAEQVAYMSDIGVTASALEIEAKSSVPITKGNPVYVTSWDFSGNIPNVGIADVSNVNTMPSIGIAKTSVAAGVTFSIIVLGNINIDTSAWSPNQAIYVSTGGSLTNVRPSSYSQVVGIVLNSSFSNGILHVNIQDSVSIGNSYQSINDTGQLTFATTTKTLISGLTATSLQSGIYRFDWYWEQQNSSINTEPIITAEVSGLTYGVTVTRTSNTANYVGFMGFADVTTSGTKTFQLWYTGSNTNNVLIRNRRISIRRIY
jgi:hypothetical protein